ncbi:excisionase family DNA-binding protein [Microcoleus anatoxicus]|uniref:Excisionase family DNA-binding protein n=1 Tax=Microcoleus anatoxicus PTRS2 TaxID=2705321 RepID=A0ABU8YVF5_9CYAN|nr:MAG: helix-turn-helix domain-containing protein [Oscillatoriales cyanobacterium]TAF44591.1 MAG: helix-turn-helix domain-containing protein [Oscillatoriales cyanobacterium]
MNRQKILLDPVLPTEAETLAIKLLDKMLCLKIENDDSETLQVKLLEINGEAIALPESLYQLLCQAAHLMAAGKAVSLVPIEQDMTVEEAASLLNVSQEFVVKLLDNGEIPYGKVGNQRRISLAGAIGYKQQRTIKRREILKELAEFSQEEELHETRVYS